MLSDLRKDRSPLIGDLRMAFLCRKPGIVKSFGFRSSFLGTIVRSLSARKVVSVFFLAACRFRGVGDAVGDRESGQCRGWLVAHVCLFRRLQVKCQDDVLSVEKDVLLRASPVLRQKHDAAPEGAMVVMDNVTTGALARVRDYCLTHAGRKPLTASSLAAYDEALVKLEPSALCELASAAYHLEVKGVVDLSCQAIAQLLKGKSPAEIRRTFNILYDFTPEDQIGLAPFQHGRRVNGKQLTAPPAPAPAAVPAAPATPAAPETRSVDELLQFINASGPASSSASAKKKKKKKSKKKPRAQAAASDANGAVVSVEKEFVPPVSAASVAGVVVNVGAASSPSGSSSLSAASVGSVGEEAEEETAEEDLAIEQEVIEFERRLNSVAIATQRPKISLPQNVAKALSQQVK